MYIALCTDSLSIYPEAEWKREHSGVTFIMLPIKFIIIDLIDK